MNDYKIMRFANGAPVVELKGYFNTTELMVIIEEMKNIPDEICVSCGGSGFDHKDGCENNRLYPLKDA